MIAHYIHASTGHLIVTAISNTIQDFKALCKALNHKASIDVYNMQSQQKMIITFDSDVSEDDVRIVINNIKKGETK